MAASQEGHGFSYTFTGITLKPKKLQIPGWSKDWLDLTNLTNTEWMTGAAAALKKSKNFKLVTEMDVDLADGLPETAGPFAITDGTKTYTVYCQLVDVENVDIEAGAVPLYELEFGVTNLNAGIETGPAVTP